MAVFKCKMCGGSLEIKDGESVAVCEYCGTRQTLPRLDNDKKQQLYDRANHFRRNNEFDKAIGIYEQILNEDNTDAESYWSLVLCRYGIEYVEDPKSHKRVPTVNRAQFTSIFDDEDYKSAIKYADEMQKEIYEQEATEINEIQKGILEISKKEEPFDVFICYKETDEGGRRTQDSVLATELYNELTKIGFKVFFSKITLENKLGIEYEPYIFAALNSAKVMVVIGTKPEYFNAAWVKNEWSRFLSLIKSGADKMLIPAYRDMDPYNLPEEFSNLQAQDMAKLGFMQDLIHGIKKIVSPDEKVREEKSDDEEEVSTQNLIDLAFLAIEESSRRKAFNYLERASLKEPRNPMIYVARLLMEKNIPTMELLSSLAEPFDNSINYKRAIKFAEPELKETLENYNKAIIEKKLKAAYFIANRTLENANTEAEIKKARFLFEKLGDYNDSKEKIEACDIKAEELRKSKIYREACELFVDDSSEILESLEEARALFMSISDFKDSQAKADECERKIAAEETKQEKNRRKRIITTMIFVFVTVVTVLTVIILTNFVLPVKHFSQASDFFTQGKYEEAYEHFAKAKNYNEADDYAKECLYRLGAENFKKKDYDKSNYYFEQIKDYKNSAELIHPHQYKLIKSVKPTCTKDGSKTYKCPCGSVKTDVIKALGHDFTEATCTAPKKCRRCGKVEGKALGHNISGNFCTRCGRSTFKTMKFSGRGPGYVKNINLPEGNYNICGKFTSTDKYGMGLFSAEFYKTSSDFGEEIAWKHGNCTTIKKISVKKGGVRNAYIDVEDADGYWTFTIEACR